MPGNRYRGTLLAAALLAACATEADNGEGVSSSGATGSGSLTDDMQGTETGASENTGSSSGTTSTSTSTSTTEPVTTSPSTTPSTTGEVGDDSSTGSPLPEGPGCSVQVVSHGEVVDPLPKGEEVGLFPTSVGDALEDQCGCHTLMSNAQNVQYMGLTAPGGTLFLDYADMSRPFGGGTLGEAMASEVYGYGMPPGSCSYPSDPAAILRKWFEEGLPDGSNFTPP